MRYRAGHSRARRRSDVDGQHVVRDWWTTAEVDVPMCEVETDRLVEHRPGIGEPSEDLEIDVRLVVRVMARHDAGEHARVWCLDIPRDQRQADPGERLHAESLQHGDMAMSAANQHQVFDDRNVRKHSLKALFR